MVIRKLFAICLILLSSTFITACEGGDRDDLTSPCVGIEGSPCDEKRMVNDWWLA